MAAGRPSKYKKSYCKKAKEYLAQGNSNKALCGFLGVGEKTLYEWAKIHPEFRKSIDEGKFLGESYYLNEARRMIGGGKGNYNALAFLMKNIYRYSDNPTDTTEEKPIEITFTVKKEPEQ